MSHLPVRKLNKRLIYWCLVGLIALSLPAVISLASFGNREESTEKKNKEAHPNLFVHDANAITGTEHFPDTYSDIKDFEKELAKNQKVEEPVIDSFATEIEQAPPAYVQQQAVSSHYGYRNDDPWQEAKMREQKQRASDHYGAKRSDIMFVNNVKNRKSENSSGGDDDNLIKARERALAMQEKANSLLQSDDTLLINSNESKNFWSHGKNSAHGRIKNPSRFMVSEGTLIPAILLSEINTDHPGPILARVSQNIWDSKTGQSLLIPQNSKLIGEYNSTVGHGQQRAQIVWTRIIYPNQQSIDLGRMVGVNKKATSGSAGNVDNHYDKVALALLMTTTLGAGVRMTQGKYDRNNSSIGEDFGNSLAQETTRIGSRIADQMLSIKPTITVPMGERLNVFVEQDLHLEPYSG